jgi:hypothetical protein
VDGETTECAARFLRRRRHDGVSSHFDRKGVRPGTAGAGETARAPSGRGGVGAKDFSGLICGDF